ncbi:MAG: hypothetical protein AAGG48_16795 [Planctomycetota bacterium]
MMKTAYAIALALATTAAFGQPPKITSEINKLQEAYRGAEQAAATTAATLRANSEAADPNAMPSVKLRDQLRTEIRRAFELRLELQQMLLADAERKLERTRGQLERREQLAEKIIDRRFQDLVSDANTDWETDPLVTPIESASTEPRAEPQANPPALRLNNYRRFLLNAIGSVQARRGDRLEGIAAIEQQYLEIASNSGRTSKVDAEKREEVIASLKAQMDALDDEVKIYDQQIEALRKKLQESVQEKKDPVALNGHVIRFSEDGNPVIDLGGEDGIAPGMKLQVRRDGTSISTIEILKVGPDTASARVDRNSGESSMDVIPGDHVQLRLDSFDLAVLGLDDGMQIYNDRLKRFKFRLEHIDVYDVAEAGQRFWRRYLAGDNPEITGVWGDPRTNSLVIIGPPEAEQAIRETLARDESLAATGFDPQPSDSLEDQQRRLAGVYNELLKDVAEIKLEIIDTKADLGPNAPTIAESSEKLAKKQGELQIVTEKLEVIAEALEYQATVSPDLHGTAK